MYVLDTDTLTHLIRGHPRVVERATPVAADIFITVATRIEQLRGRFDAVFKAENGEKLLQAQLRLIEADNDLSRIPILQIDPTAAVEFDKLLQNKKLKKIGRGDLLIASIVLANRATLVTRNLKDFRQVPGLQIENWAD
ncbi:MAG TPA: type II toxin-antitoxin system VapC family toxin [Gemmataceae bacterium]|nr:type II toxin-antitoxin system VapC family toxin [Gemmataceae bacterium]